MRKKSLLKFIKSNEFALTVAILSVLVQSFHSFTAFYNISSLKGTTAGVIQAVLFAIVVDLAVLFYTVRNKKEVVFFASVFLFVINAYYYFDHLGFVWQLFFAAFLSILVPVTQYYYSEEIGDDEETGPDYVSELKSANDTLNMYSGKIEHLKKERDEAAEHLGRRLNDLEVAEKKNHELAEAYYQAVAQRDSLRNNNSVLSEALGRRVAEIHELKKRTGEIPADQPLEMSEERDRVIDEIREKMLPENEVQDKSLLNIAPDDHSITRTNGPVTNL